MNKIKKIISLFFFTILFHNGIFSQAKISTIAVIGTGYVGLVTGTCFAHLGYSVICVDIDEKKINELKKGIVSIYEPQLTDLLRKELSRQKLFFTTHAEKAIKQADIVFIAVDTPMNDDGNAYMGYLNTALETIGKALQKKTIICIKSTVPIGTTDYAEQLLLSHNVSSDLFDMVMNPEFLREGSAVYDFLNPDRIVVGSHSFEAAHTIKNLYEPLLQEKIPCVLVDPATAETIKYASNSFLAVKISFINEIANLCEKTGADICQVSHAMGLDKRIGSYFLKHGPGFGGSCFPKDCNALLHIAKNHGVILRTLAACLQTNQEQRTVPVKKLLEHLVSLDGTTIAVLGLSFKAGTNDIRNSCAITTLELLQKHGAHIKAYDPIANNAMQKLFPDIQYCNSLETALCGCDAAIIMTDWCEFKQLENAPYHQIMKRPLIIDACNVLDCKNRFLQHFVISKIGKR